MYVDVESGCDSTVVKVVIAACVLTLTKFSFPSVRFICMTYCLLDGILVDEGCRNIGSVRSKQEKRFKPWSSKQEKILHFFSKAAIQNKYA